MNLLVILAVFKIVLSPLFLLSPSIFRVDVTDNVKISDAAFSWDLYPAEYMYDQQKDRYMPVRWMAPESLSTGFYDKQSDVVSTSLNFNTAQG